MRLKIERPGVWLSAISAILVVAFVYWDRGKVSPGPLSATHAQDPNLAGDGCAQCHGGPLGSMTSACIECHAEIGAQIANKKGFHGTMTSEPNKCAACHSEHHGADFPLTGTQSFALAGFVDRTHFDHRNLDYHLTGRHAALSCVECHQQADAAVLAKGEKRFLGLTASCTQCHEDVHDGKLPDCAACHGQEHEFKKVANFVHGAQFPLTGSHSKPGCLDCHPKSSPHAVEALASHGTIVESSAPTPRTCQECHPSPHSDAFVHAAALKTGVKDGAACEACHPSSHTTFAASEAKMDPARHALSGFPLDAPHDKARCTDCHAAADVGAAAPADFAAFRSAHPGRSADACQVCHGDPHGGQFAEVAGANCLACHDRHSFAPHSFGIAQHARTHFALTGSHAAVSCNECHKETRPVDVVSAAAQKPVSEKLSARVFHGTSKNCESCHRDAHDRWFARAGLDEVVAGETGCARCHTTNVFAEVRKPGFEHGKWTGFVLEGAHARSDCTSCHIPSARADDAGRTFGRVADHFKGPAGRCSTCHADAHRGFFERPEIAANLAASGAGRPTSPADCAQCHTQESFGETAVAFDHGQFTGYTLEGAHARQACTTCHAPSAVKDASGRSFGFSRVGARAANKDCRACHLDPHQGGFDRAAAPGRVDGREGCLRCHTTESFEGTSRAAFDHKLWTGFALDGAHAKATCESCHVPQAAADGRAQLFGKAAGTDCAACHADPHVAQFAKNGSTDCARCHTTDAFDAGHFDHQKDARFALDATHQKLTCSACHLPAPLPGGGAAIRYKPLGISCGDCHDPRGGTRRSRDPFFGTREIEKP